MTYSPAVLHTRFFFTTLTNCNARIDFDATASPSGACINGYPGSAIMIDALADNAAAIGYAECFVPADFDSWPTSDPLTVRAKRIDQGAYPTGAPRTPDLQAHIHDTTWLVEITDTDIDTQALTTTYATYTADRANAGTNPLGRKFLLYFAITDIGWENITDYQSVYIGEILNTYTYA